jgi:hypothetical protein
MKNWLFIIFEFFNSIGQKRTLGTNKNGSRRSRLWLTLNRYTSFRLAVPIKPNKPALMRRNVAGSGTA